MQREHNVMTHGQLRQHDMSITASSSMSYYVMLIHRTITPQNVPQMTHDMSNHHVVSLVPLADDESSNLTSYWNITSPCLSSAISPSSDCMLEGLMGIMFWYQSRLSSRVSRISWQSGWTRSAHASHSG